MGNSCDMTLCYMSQTFLLRDSDPLNQASQCFLCHTVSISIELSFQTESVSRMRGLLSLRVNLHTFQTAVTSPKCHRSLKWDRGASLENPYVVACLGCIRRDLIYFGSKEARFLEHYRVGLKSVEFRCFMSQEFLMYKE